MTAVIVVLCCLAGYYSNMLGGSYCELDRTPNFPCSVSLGYCGQNEDSEVKLNYLLEVVLVDAKRGRDP